MLTRPYEASASYSPDIVLAVLRNMSNEVLVSLTGFHPATKLSTVTISAESPNCLTSERAAMGLKHSASLDYCSGGLSRVLSLQVV